MNSLADQIRETLTQMQQIGFKGSEEHFAEKTLYHLLRLAQEVEKIKEKQ